MSKGRPKCCETEMKYVGRHYDFFQFECGICESFLVVADDEIIFDNRTQKGEAVNP